MGWQGGDLHNIRRLSFASPPAIARFIECLRAWAQKNGLEIELSPAGRVAEQIISALGGLDGVRMIGNEELIKAFDRMANGTLEVEVSGEDQSVGEKRRLRKSSIPLWQIQSLLKRANNDNAYISQNHLSALLGSNVLILGMEVPCSECEQSTWFALETSWARS